MLNYDTEVLDPVLSDKKILENGISKPTFLTQLPSHAIKRNRLFNLCRWLHMDRSFENG